MLESSIERAVCAKVLDQLGVSNIKLVTPGRTGFPDRMFLIPGGKPLMIEFKRPGEKPEPMQAHIHSILRMLGYSVEVHDDIEAAVEAVRSALHAAQVSAHGNQVSP